MNKCNKLLLLSSMALLFSCNAPKEESSSVKSCDVFSQEIIDALKVVNGDAITGNIYLPNEVDGKAITWKSSDPSIISATKIENKEPGVVTRQSEDKQVTLTASIEEGESCYAYSQTVTVKAAPKAIADEDYVGYLFGHFISEDGREEDGQKIAVGEQMYFAFADEGKGLHFKDLSTRNNPILSSVCGERGVRDPFMMRSPEGDKFYIVATDLSVYTRGGWGQNQNDKFSKNGSHSLVFWESSDLISWSESRLLDVAPDNAGMAWAPEMIYHEETGQYVIFFASCLVNEDHSEKIEKDAIYYVTTRDFVHISEPKLLIPNQDNGNRIVIDASLLRLGNVYYSAVKDGDNNVDGGGILIQKTTDLFNPESWQRVGNLADTGFTVEGGGWWGGGGAQPASNKNLEGPEWFIYNRADRTNPEVPEYGLMGDQYLNSGAGYLPFATTDIDDIHNERNSWRKLTAGQDADYSWDSLTKRHGTIMRLTKGECEAIRGHSNLEA